MIEIDGKKYQLKEAFTIHEQDVETRWGDDWNDDNTYEVDVATDVIRVEKAFVLIEVEQEE